MASTSHFAAGFPGPAVDAYGAGGAARHWQALGIALTLETALIAAAAAWLVFHGAKPPTEIVPITIEAPIIEERPPQPEPPKLAPPEPPVPKPAPAKIVQVARAHVDKAQPLVKPAEPTPAVDTPTAFSTPAVVAPPPPPPAPVIQQGPSAEYVARVKAAVQAAVVYPPAAAALNFRGRARVEFRLRDGVASQARIVTSSGMGLVDRAALKSIQVAEYPAPPTSSQGKEETYQVWVEFNL